MTWQTRAACRGRDPELFFIAKGDNGQQVDEARQVCRACPVADACLAFALKEGTFGIWAGTTENQRKRLGSHPRGSRDRDVIGIRHGTLAGARAHYRRGEQPCWRCRQAEHERSAEKYAEQLVSA